VSEIRISPVVQVVIAVAALLGIAAIVGAQVPEIQRYLKARRM
jgi:uncharacterized protein DUF6893